MTIYVMTYFVRKDGSSRNSFMQKSWATRSRAGSILSKLSWISFFCFGVSETSVAAAARGLALWPLALLPTGSWMTADMARFPTTQVEGGAWGDRA